MPLRALSTPLSTSAVLPAARRGFAGQPSQAVTQVGCLSRLLCGYSAKQSASQPRCVSALQAPLAPSRFTIALLRSCLQTECALRRSTCNRFTLLCALQEPLRRFRRGAHMAEPAAVSAAPEETHAQTRLMREYVRKAVGESLGKAYDSVTAGRPKHRRAGMHSSPRRLLECVCECVCALRHHTLHCSLNLEDTLTTSSTILVVHAEDTM